MGSLIFILSQILFLDIRFINAYEVRRSGVFDLILMSLAKIRDFLCRLKLILPALHAESFGDNYTPTAGFELGHRFVRCSSDVAI